MSLSRMAHDNQTIFEIGFRNINICIYAFRKKLSAKFQNSKYFFEIFQTLQIFFTFQIKDAGGQEFKKFIDKQYIGPTDSEKLFQGVSGVFDLLQIAVRIQMF